MSPFVTSNEGISDVSPRHLGATHLALQCHMVRHSHAIQRRAQLACELHRQWEEYARSAPPWVMGRVRCLHTPQQAHGRVQGTGQGGQDSHQEAGLPGRGAEAAGVGEVGCSTAPSSAPSLKPLPHLCLTAYPRSQVATKPRTREWCLSLWRWRTSRGQQESTRCMALPISLNSNLTHTVVL